MKKNGIVNNDVKIINLDGYTYNVKIINLDDYTSNDHYIFNDNFEDMMKNLLIDYYDEKPSIDNIIDNINPVPSINKIKSLIDPIHNEKKRNS